MWECVGVVWECVRVCGSVGIGAKISDGFNIMGCKIHFFVVQELSEAKAPSFWTQDIRSFTKTCLFGLW